MASTITKENKMKLNEFIKELQDVQSEKYNYILRFYVDGKEFKAVGVVEDYEDEYVKVNLEEVK